MPGQQGCVYLVGAGPGHPGLLTLRGLECLRRADLIIHDRLVSARVLDMARPEAACICTSRLAGPHSERGRIIQDRLIAASRAGQIAVRLKGGDPLIFARLAEETAALRQAGVPYEIVPGISAAQGAAAFAEIPLTQRDSASAVAFVTGHECAGKSSGQLDWPGISHFPGTIVFYMGMTRLEDIVTALLANGKSPNTPAVVVQNATRGNQSTVRAPLGELILAAAKAELGPPSVVIVGPTAQWATGPTWAEKRPLFGKRILVARPREQGLAFASQLEELGATPIVIPALTLAPPDDWAPVDQAIARIRDFDWLVFTSANGVQAFVDRLEHNQRDLRVLGQARLAAIGPATAAALAAFHLRADLIPVEYVSEALAAELRAVVAGRRVLLVRAQQGRDILREELAAVAQVEQIAVYRQMRNPDLEELLGNCWAECAPDFVALTSSNIAQALLRVLSPQMAQSIRNGAVRLITISPVTSAAVKEFDLPIAAEANRYSTEGILTKLVELAKA
jgi:uroporphyrinogen III methyltransferase / synthase